MEEENQVFGVEAENKDDFNSEEKFSIYHKDKEDAEKNLQASAKELNDFFDSLIKDEPDPTAEEVNEGIRKILERAYPEKKTNKSKKVALKVLFIAALLSALSFSCLFAIGNSHNISIENGFVTFAKDTVKVVFFGEDEEKEECITIDALLTDLKFHGYSYVMFPEEFVSKTNEYKASIPDYIEDVNNLGAREQVSFDIYNDANLFSFTMIKSGSTSSSDLSGDFKYVDNAETVIFDDVNIYVFEHESKFSSIHFVYNGYSYFLVSEVSLSEMINIAQTIIKVEG